MNFLFMKSLNRSEHRMQHFPKTNPAADDNRLTHFKMMLKGGHSPQEGDTVHSGGTQSTEGDTVHGGGHSPQAVSYTHLTLPTMAVV